MEELVVDMKKQYPTFYITPQHLGQVVRDNNQTRKRTRHEHFPKEKYKKPIEKATEILYCEQNGIKNVVLFDLSCSVGEYYQSFNKVRNNADRVETNRFNTPMSAYNNNSKPELMPEVIAEEMPEVYDKDMPEVIAELIHNNSKSRSKKNVKRNV